MRYFAPFLLTVVLFSSSAFADGDMGTGGRTCPPGQTCFVGDGDMGTGGKTCPKETFHSTGDSRQPERGDLTPEDPACFTEPSMFDLVEAFLTSLL